VITSECDYNDCEGKDESLCYTLLDNWVLVRYFEYMRDLRRKVVKFSIKMPFKSRPMTVHADITGHYHNCRCIMAIFNFAALSIDPPKWLHCYHTAWWKKNSTDANTREDSTKKKRTSKTPESKREMIKH